MATYYAGHLRKIQRSLANRLSILGRHHQSLNAFIVSGLAAVPDGGDVLDAGCGLGIWATSEVRRRHRVYGVDSEIEAIESCKKLYPDSRFSVGDLYALGYPDQSFHAVVMREVIEHLRWPETAVREVRRVLRPGGRYILTTPNYDSWLLHVIEHTYNRFFGGPCKPYRDDVHPSKFRVESLKGLIGSYFALERYVVLDWGISLGCVARKT
jgi:ubiquinone/menaquinone biosynthesis C-methylase UbiE